MQPSKASPPPRQPKSWRDLLPIHPAANLLPLWSPGELKTNSEDIKKNGLQVPITVSAERVGGEWRYQLLDGRNRLDAIEFAGFNTIAAKRSRGRADRLREGMECGLDPFLGLPDGLPGGDVAINYIPPPDDPYAFNASANVHRRQLTAKQKREYIGKLIKATLEKSDRQIAGMVGASPTTVGTVRAEMEAKGEVSKLDTRTDAKGVRQPAKRKPMPPRPSKSPDPVAERYWDLAAPLNDITDSPGEIKRKRERLEELETVARRLETENARLRSEVEDLRSENADLCQAIEQNSKEFTERSNEFYALCSEVEDLRRENAGLREALEQASKEFTERSDEFVALRDRMGQPAPPPADDGLDIPPFLDRTRAAPL